MAAGTSKSNFQWAEGPIPLISTVGPRERPFANKIGVETATRMVAIHNIINRGFNAAYNQAQSIKPGTQDASDFLVYNQLLYEFITQHHTTEDELFFPSIEKANKTPGSMSINSQQHETFHDGLEEFGNYAKNTSKEDYDGKKLCDILDSFRTPMQIHLQEEITTLLDLKDENQKELQEALDTAHNHAINSMDKHRDGPLVFACHDKTFKIDEFSGPIPAPFFVPYLNEYIFTRKYKGAFKFTPCTQWSLPKSSMPTSSS